MIKTTMTTETITTANLQKLLYNRELINQLARELVAGQVEGHIDIAQDMGGEISTFAEAELHIKSAQDNVEDYVEDLLTDFRDMLYDAVRKVTVEVRMVSLTNQGLLDADVNIR